MKYEDNLYSDRESHSNETAAGETGTTTGNAWEYPNGENSNRYFDRVEEPVGRAADRSGESGAAAGGGGRTPKKARKSGVGRFVKRAICAALLAVIFGGVAGGTFYGICRYTGVFERIAEEPATVQQPSELVQVPESNGNVQHVNTEKLQVVTTDVSGVVEEVIPAMVTILNTYEERGTTFWGQIYSQDAHSGGTGIIIGENDTELLIATNHHVVESTKLLEITFMDGTTAEAKIKGMDADMDLAVVAVSLADLSENTRNSIAIATLGESDQLKLGQPVLVIGNALGIGISVTDGIISGLEREMTTEDGNTGTFIQTNAAVNSGNSGGALLNIKGEVIGIVSNKIGGYSVEGMGYAIPISAANPIISELMEHKTRVDKVEESEMGYLGVTLQAVNSEAMTYYSMPSGVYVVEVEDESAAKEAGIVRRDIITKVDGEKVSSAEQLKNILQYYKAGETIQITISRLESGEYVTHDLTVTLGRRK